MAPQTDSPAQQSRSVDPDLLINEIAELRAQLDRANRLATLGATVGAIAHEFNNILTPVMSYAELALSDPADRDLAQKALRKAAQGAEKAAQISRALLGFSTGGATHDGKADVANAVEEALLCLARDPAKNGIRLTVDVEHALCAAIRPIALEQILLNLILNANEAMKRQGGSLTIEACSTWNTHDERACRITVADTGPGIPDEIRSRLFTPFTTSRRPEGTRSYTGGAGLGLAICKQLIEAAGGTIDVESTSRGTTFTITLPACPASNDAALSAAGADDVSGSR
ncbi:MAG: HAMP domain-containing sensor histidine kinase [Planctomycetota bacterium]|nr:HAMP domain-containing sensor histidine kinase [Planctomycetota bacterium]